jgi:adenylosuccinate synthase
VGVTALVGCQWGDEGKGKIVDILSERAAAVARYQGGANAGHTVVVGETTHVLHLLPVGILRDGVTCLLGNGMVIDPRALLDELDMVEKGGVRVGGRLQVSPAAHVITPFHKAVEKHREATWSCPIGTTLRGIGPAYETKAARVGLRMGDLLRPDSLRMRMAGLCDWARATGCPGADIPTVDEAIAWLEPLRPAVTPLIRDVRVAALAVVAEGGELLLEGAQGVLLDQDHGTYPYVTSSSTSAGGATLGVGLPPRSLDRVVGVCKAYTTRVGEGPFPTEFVADAAADDFRRRAGEFGATTGRPRRCGWLDGVLLRYACELNGVTALVITKLDVLDGTETLRVATGYESDAAGEVDPLGSLQSAVPIYEDIPGWEGTTAGVTRWDDLPDASRAYLDRIEAIAGVPVAMVSTGNRRDQILIRRPDLLPGT